ncbi:hypothetical protein CRE_20548 [Caenorhabditis remanei]|uniref:Uncharacterized protein n=1 Tax=Caenorhabditis remanei TaxID=31234 RepID=E3NCC2_CAERE|nr:hypothetical protein CRE_20548 [Caenorhabditis remanei]
MKVMKVEDPVEEYVKFLFWCCDNAHEIGVPTDLHTLANRYVKKAKRVKVPGKWFPTNRKRCLGEALGDLEWTRKIDTVKLCKIYFILGIEVHEDLRKKLPPNVKLNGSMQIIKMEDKRKILKAKEAESGSESEPEPEMEQDQDHDQEASSSLVPEPKRKTKQKRELERELEPSSSSVPEPKRKLEKKQEYQYNRDADAEILRQNLDEIGEEFDQFEEEEEEKYLGHNWPHVLEKRLAAPKQEVNWDAQHQDSIGSQVVVKPDEPMEQQVFDDPQDQDNYLDDGGEEEMDQFEDEEEDNYLVYEDSDAQQQDSIEGEAVFEPDEPTEHQAESGSEPEPEEEQESEQEQEDNHDEIADSQITRQNMDEIEETMDRFEDEEEENDLPHNSPQYDPQYHDNDSDDGGEEGMDHFDGEEEQDLAQNSPHPSGKGFVQQQVFDEQEDQDNELDDGDDEQIDDDERPVPQPQDHVDTLVEKFLNELEKCFLRRNKEQYKNMLDRIRFAHENATKQGHNIDAETICLQLETACRAVKEKGVSQYEWAAKGEPGWHWRDLQFVHDLFLGMLDTFSAWACILREPVEEILKDYKKTTGSGGKLISNKSIANIFEELANKMNEKINASRESITAARENEE